MSNHFSRKNLIRILTCLIFIAISSPSTLGWGDTGHRIVARIASKYLSPQTRSIVVDLLKADIKSNSSYYQDRCPDVLALGNKAALNAPDSERFAEMGLACIASWPDPPLKWERLYTSNWHFVDIPVNLQAPNGPVVSTFDVSRDCRMDDERGDCAILAIRRLRPVLANSKEQVISRAEALKFIVHIIGDIHQPLHCVTDKKDFSNAADLGDLGGNFKIVQFNVTGWDNNAHKDVNARWNEQWNLHSVWDEGIIDATMSIDKLNEDQYLAQLLKTFATIKPEEFADLQSGDWLKWISESYQVAVEKAYNLPAFDKDYPYVDKKGNKRSGGYVLNSDYYVANRGVVNEQLQSGGVRLARFLNESFK